MFFNGNKSNLSATLPIKLTIRYFSTKAQASFSESAGSWKQLTLGGHFHLSSEWLVGNGEKMPLSYRAGSIIILCLWFAQPTHILAACDLLDSPMMQMMSGLLLSLFYLFFNLYE